MNVAQWRSRPKRTDEPRDDTFSFPNPAVSLFTRTLRSSSCLLLTISNTNRHPISIFSLAVPREHLTPFFGNAAKLKQPDASIGSQAVITPDGAPALRIVLHFPNRTRPTLALRRYEEMPLSPDHSTSVPAQTPAKKRVRLSRACNVCRSRKVRCDEQQPSCSRCVAAGIDCVTTDPRSSASLSSSNRKRAGDYHASPTSNGPQQTAVGQPAPHGEIRQSAPNTGMHGVYDSHGANQNVNHQHESLRTPSSLSGSMINDSSHSSGLPRHAIQENAAEGRSEEEADSPEFAFNSAGHLEHKYMGASSLQVFTQWLEMTFRVESLDLTGRFRYGLRHCEEMDIPDSVEMPSLPNAWRSFCRAYVQDIAPLFPVAREGEIFQIADLLMVRRASDLPQRDRPRLALLYACISLGARQSQPTGDESGSYLRAACSLYAYVAAYPYLESAQALLMLSLALRAHSRDGAASQALGLAIRILQSIGLHRQASSQPMRAHDHQDSTSLSRPVQQQAQSFHHSQEIWWAAYCLERISSLESGRPSSISDEDVDQVPEFDQLQAPYQAYLISLTKIQGDINRQLFSNHTKHTFTSPRDIFYIQSRLDRQLYSWYSDLPQRLRLDGELLTFEPRTVAARAFLLMQYHSTLAGLPF